MAVAVAHHLVILLFSRTRPLFRRFLLRCSRASSSRLIAGVRVRCCLPYLLVLCSTVSLQGIHQLLHLCCRWKPRKLQTCVASLAFDMFPLILGCVTWQVMELAVVDSGIVLRRDGREMSLLMVANASQTCTLHVRAIPILNERNSRILAEKLACKSISFHYRWSTESTVWRFQSIEAALRHIKDTFEVVQPYSTNQANACTQFIATFPYSKLTALANPAVCCYPEHARNTVIQLELLGKGKGKGTHCASS